MTFLGRRSFWIFLLCALLVAVGAAGPFLRTFYNAELNYNEGWNVENAATLTHHQLLYPLRYGWTSVNYPMLSFVIVAQLHRITHDLLFTARVLSLLSLLAAAALVGLIVQALGGTRRSAWLSGLMCIALVCEAAFDYVGVDDPHMLSLPLFLVGLLLYIRRRGTARLSYPVLAAIALLFVAAGCIKHSSIDIPVVVLLDLLFVSPRRAAWFAVCGLAMAAAAVGLQIHYGGPYFVAQMVSSRGFSWHKAQGLNGFFLKLLFPVILVALGTAAAVWRKKEQRIAVVFLVVSIALEYYFSAGQGTAFNVAFSVLLAMALLFGLFVAGIETRQWRWTQAAWSAFVPVLFFAFLTWREVHLFGGPVTVVRRAAASQAEFRQDVAFLRGRPGPALCMSILRCFEAGKPYEVDPFNSARLIQQHKLDEDVLVQRVRERDFGAIQLYAPALLEDKDFLTLPVQEAINESYVPVVSHPDGVHIYVPRNLQ